MRSWLAIAFLLLGTGGSSAAIEAVNIFEPRKFGYFIGDTLERRVEVIASGDTQLFTAALPRPGPLTYWLDLVSIDHQVREANGRRIYDIALKYQIFYSALEAKKLDIPAFPLRFKSPGDVASSQPGSYTASVPALGLVVSPLREIVVSDLMSEKSNELSDIMQPDTRAQEINMGRKLSLLTASGAAVAASGLLLLWHYAIWPFARGPQRPFTQAERQIRKRQFASSDAASYGDLLLILHRAFDQSAGRRVFAADLPEFIATHERFGDLGPKLKAFFESSRLYFFSDDRRLAEDHFPSSELKRLASDLARQERAAA